jgi:predicted Mrr-cat superfamily restriction endonuclease
MKTTPQPEKPMPIKPQELAALMHEVELEDPIDFADLPFPEEELRELVAAHLCEMAASMENFSTEDRLLTLLAVSAKLVLENLVLNVQLLRRHGQPVSDNVQDLLNRLRKRDAD